MLSSLLGRFRAKDKVSKPVGRPAYRHGETFLSLEETSVDRRLDFGFRKTFPYRGDFIDERHAGFGSCKTVNSMIDIGIDGWLLPADAMKLYELSYFVAGDILELGTYRGLSSNVMREAIVASGSAAKLISIDLDPGSTLAGRQSTEGKPGADRLFFFNTSADEALGTFRNAARRFGFCFMDHSHAYEHVRSACLGLPGVLEPGGFCLFHDYNDPRNADASDHDYGVHQAVNDVAREVDLQFWGIYGCCGLFRHCPG